MQMNGQDHNIKEHNSQQHIIYKLHKCLEITDPPFSGLMSNKEQQTENIEIPRMTDNPA